VIEPKLALRSQAVISSCHIPKQGFVAGGAAAVAVAGGLPLGRPLRFHHHTPQQLPTGLAFRQQAADELGGNHLGGAGEKGWGESLKGGGAATGTGLRR